MPHYKGIKKTFADSYGDIHADGFWSIVDIRIELDRRRGFPPAAGIFAENISITLMAFRDEASFDGGSDKDYPETKIITAAAIEQFPSISSWADLRDYALQVVKNHPTQTYFNDGALIEV